MLMLTTNRYKWQTIYVNPLSLIIGGDKEGFVVLIVGLKQLFERAI